MGSYRLTKKTLRERVEDVVADLWDFTKGLAVVLFWAVLIFASLLATLGLVSGVLNHITFPGEVAAIEQLRQDSQNTPLAAAEAVFGQVTEANQKIVTYQRYNQVVAIDWLVPDGWDTVEFIDLPGGNE